MVCFVWLRRGRESVREVLEREVRKWEGRFR